MKKYSLYLVSVIMLFGSMGVHAQKQGQEAIDSLLQVLRSGKEDTTKVDVLISLSFQYHSVNPDQGIKYGQEALDLATKLDWQKGIGVALNKIGINYQFKSEYDTALIFEQRALKICEDIGYKKGAVSACNAIGGVYNYLCDYPKALEYFLRSLKTAEELGDKKGMSDVTGNIGLVYQSQKDYPKALDYYQRSLKMHEALGDKVGIAAETGNIGVIYYYQHDYSKALEYDFKQLAINEETGDSSSMAITTGYVGDVYASMKNYELAIEYGQKSLKMAAALGDKHQEATELEYVGYAYLSLATDTEARAGMAISKSEMAGKKYQPDIETIPAGKTARLSKAIDYLRRALALSREIQTPDVMKDCYENLSAAYSATGDYKNALDARDSFMVLSDTLYSNETNEKILEMGIKYDYDKKAAETQKADALKLQRQQFYTWMGAAGMLLLLCFLFIIARNNKLLAREKKRSEDLLLNILPEEIANELKDKGESAARHYENVTVIFTDFVDFTKAGERMAPQALVNELDICFKAFDAICDKYNIEKIKTIGDAYLAVCGLPLADPSHAVFAVKAAKEMLAFMVMRYERMGNKTFEVRIGIHSGNVVAGIVGVKKFAYDIWGDAVNTAARVEQNCEAGKINISEATYDLVKHYFACTYRGEIEAKNKGVMKMYYVEGTLPKT